MTGGEAPGTTRQRAKPRCRGTYENDEGRTQRCGLSPRHGAAECGPGPFTEPGNVVPLPQAKPKVPRRGGVAGTVPAGPLARRPSRFSATYVERAEGCLHASYLSRRGDVGGDRLDRGKVIHEGNQAIARYAYENGLEKVDPELVEEIVTTALKTPEEPIPLSLGDYRDAIEHGRNYAGAMEFWPDADLFLVEHLVVAEIGPFTFSGRIDLLQVKGPLCRIDDTKSSPFVPDKETIAKTIQNPLYGRLVWQQLPYLEQFDLAQVYTALPGEYARIPMVDPPAFATLEDIMAVDDYLDVLGARLDATWEAYEGAFVEGNGDELAAKLFPPRGGEHCRRCPAKRLCPIPQGLNPWTAVATPEEARAALAQVVAVDEWRTDTMTALKAFVGDDGHVDEAGMRVSWRKKAGGWGIRKGMSTEVYETLTGQAGEERAHALMQNRRPGRDFKVTKVPTDGEA